MRSIIGYNLFYSENRDTDQLQSHCTADQQFCFAYVSDVEAHTTSDLHCTVLYFMRCASFLSCSLSSTSGISREDLDSRAASESAADFRVFFSS